MPLPLRATYVGGPTALVEFHGLRLLTDPTLDPAPTDYPTPVYTLHKSQPPALTPQQLAPIDIILLSHDHHFDNLDHAGRQLCAQVPLVLTTIDGATRLGGSAVGLQPWQSHDLRAPDGTTIRITATPARPGPPGGDRGPCIGFTLATTDDPRPALYISGDTVFYDGVEEVAEKFDVQAALLFCGAARVAVAGPHDLTMSAADAVRAAQAFPRATISPLHFEGWTHFTQSRAEIDQAFAAAHLTNRLRWLPPGPPVEL
jgi:L-ascorbate metabolism protein UlaG (beta-lactamase superfamily)